MFETPGAKRVKRSEFQRSASSSSEPSRSASPKDDHSTHQPAYAFEYEFIDTHQADPSITKDEPTEDQKFEFRLFASTTTTPAKSRSNTAPKATITLRPSPSPSNALSQGRFLNPHRPKPYYFTSFLSPSYLASLRQQYRQSAISSSTLVNLATHQRWPGTALPGRVLHLNPPKSKSAPSSQPKILSPRDPSKRSKPNKKRRIQTRLLLAARQAAANAAVRATETAEEKEKALREKKAAKNRKVQLKRREKERMRKADLKISGSGADGVDASVGASGVHTAAGGGGIKP